MEVRSYNSELAIANLLFKKIFSNIQIERTHRTTKNKKLFPVDCIFEQRSRILKNWENAEKRATYTLPLILINRTGYVRNPERLNGMNNEVKYEITSTNRNENLLTPVPIDISYDVVVMAKYPSDIDQIASNFMVFFNSDIYVTCIHPKYDGIRMNNQVIMSDSISEEHSSEIDGSADDIITTTFQFTFKTYLFGGMTQAKRVPSKILSSYLSTVISSNVISLSPYQITDYCKQHPNAYLSAVEVETVSTEVTALVDNPETSSLVYDDFVPIINQINAGFYPVPQTSSYGEYMDMVDNYELSAQPYYVDRLYWKIDLNSDEEFPNNVKIF